MDQDYDPDWIPEPDHPPQPDHKPTAFQIALENREPDTPLVLAKRSMWDPPTGVAPSHHQNNDRSRRRERDGRGQGRGIGHAGGSFGCVGGVGSFNNERRPNRFNGSSSHDLYACIECKRYNRVPLGVTHMGGGDRELFGCGCTGTTPFGCGSGNSTGYGGGRFARDNVGGAPVCQCVHAARNTLRKPHPAHK